MKDYRVGIVVARCGLMQGQLLVVRKKLDDIAAVLEDGGVIHFYVPGYDLKQPETSVPEEVRNLRYRHKVKVEYLAQAWKGETAARHVMSEFERLQCDEVWCCPASGQMAGSTARVAMVWKFALRSGAAVARRYKLVPPWSEAPGPAEKPKPKKDAAVKKVHKAHRGSKGALRW